MTDTVPDLRAWLGDIDIYLFDQIQRGRFRPGMKVLDAGAGGGRNLHWFLRAGYDVSAADKSLEMVANIREAAAQYAPHLPADNFRVEDLRTLSYEDGRFDAVVCIAVLHFAADDADFDRMLDSLWRVMRPGAVLFTRLASNIGLEHAMKPLGNRRYTMPDGTDRFVVDEQFLIDRTERIGGRLLDPIKTVNVQGQRCMTNWCVEKRG